MLSLGMGTPPSKETIARMVAEQKAHRKADWIELAARDALHSGKEFSPDGLADLYDEIQKFRNIESA